MAKADAYLDLAELEYNRLLQVAKDARVKNWSSLPRRDLVAAIREQGIGTRLPGAAENPGTVQMIAEIGSLKEAVEDCKHVSFLESSTLREEISGLRKEVGKLMESAADAQGSRTRSTDRTAGPGPHAVQHAPRRTLAQKSVPVHVPTQPTSPAAPSSVDLRYVKATATTDHPDVLSGVNWFPKCVVYVGNISRGCSADSIRAWCQDRGVEVLTCSVIESRTFGTCYARVTFAATDEETVLGPKFWPTSIQYTVRKWRFADSAQLNPSSSNVQRR